MQIKEYLNLFSDDSHHLVNSLFNHTIDRVVPFHVVLYLFEVRLSHPSIAFAIKECWVLRLDGSYYFQIPNMVCFGSF